MFTSLLADWEYEFVGKKSADINYFYNGGKYIYLSSNRNFFRYDKESTETIEIKDSLFDDIRIGAIIEYDGTLLVSTSNGILKSNDFGDNWEELESNLNLSLVNSFCVTDEYLFALSNNGVFRKIKSNPNWQLVSKEYNSYAENMKLSGSRLLYHRSNTSYSDGGFLYSTNKGSQWKFIESYVGDADLLGDTIVYIYDDRISKSFNFTESWTRDTLDKRSKNVVLSKDKIYLVTYSNDIICYDYNLNETVLKNMDLINNNKRIRINNAKIENDSLLIATSNGLYIYNIVNEELDLINPKVDMIDYNTINKYKDSILITTYYDGTYIKHEDDDNWKKFDTLLYNLGYVFYKAQEINNELYLFDPYMYQQKTVVLFKKENKQWDSLLLAKYSNDGFGKINDTYYYCDGEFVLYSSDTGINWDTLRSPVYDNGEPQRVRNLSIFKNKLYIGASTGIYRYNTNNNWQEIKKDNGYSIFHIDRFHQDEERLFAVGSYSETFLFEYNKYNDVFETKMKQPISYFSYTNFENLLWNADNFIWKVVDSLYLSKDYGETKLHINENLKSLPFDHHNLIGENIYSITENGLFKRNISDFGLTNVEFSDILKPKLLVYPQPAKDELRIDISELTYDDIAIKDISIYDYTGNKISTNREIKIQSNNKKLNILLDCSDIRRGVYIIEVKSSYIKVLIE